MNNDFYISLRNRKRYLYLAELEEKNMIDIVSIEAEQIKKRGIKKQ